MVDSFVKVLCHIKKWQVQTEESLPDEIEEDDESEPNLNYDVQAFQDDQGEREIKIYNMEGKEEKLSQPKKVAITDEKVTKSRKKRGTRGLDDHFSCNMSLSSKNLVAMSHFLHEKLQRLYFELGNLHLKKLHSLCSSLT